MMTLNMTNSMKQSDKQPQTPFDKFTEAAKKVFNLPKSEVEKVKAKPTPKMPKRRK